MAMMHQKNLESIVHELGNSGQFRKFVSYCIEASDKKHMDNSLAQAMEEAIVKKEEAPLLEALERSLEISVPKCYKSFHRNRQAYLWQKYKALLKIIGMILILIAICIGIGWVLNRYEKLPFKKYAYHYVLSLSLIHI